MSVNKEEIEKSVDVVDWLCLRAHLQRGGVVIIDASLELNDIAYKIADNDSDSIKEFINDGKINKPSYEQIKQWDEQPAKLFKTAIISPYVIIQELI